MITITRRQARRLAGVLRRRVLGIYHRNPIPALVFRTMESEFRVEFQHGGLAVIYIEPGGNQLYDTVALPLEGLTDIEGPSQAPARIISASFEQTVTTYVSVGAERRHEYDIPLTWTLDPFPELPTVWKPCPASLAIALTTFAKAQGNDLAVDPDNERKRSPTASALSRLLGGQVLLLGQTPTHLAVRSGPWSMLVRQRPRVQTRREPRPEPPDSHAENPDEPE
ncbi:MAG: hypothetical protein P4L84_32775 [Isosphaeraceae bacterium]|nr:hypothetical protein [Isosphaeraceae bacterium]